MTGRSCNGCRTRSSLAAPRPIFCTRAVSSLKERYEALRRVDGAGCGGDDAFEKEVEPGFPVACSSNPIQEPIVLVPMVLEIQAQVEQGLLQDAGIMQQQRYQSCALLE